MVDQVQNRESELVRASAFCMVLQRVAPFVAGPDEFAELRELYGRLIIELEASHDKFDELRDLCERLLSDLRASQDEMDASCDRFERLHPASTRQAARAR